MAAPDNREPRISTGIPGLDLILKGGLPAHHIYLLEGTPGTGKTTMALQYLLAGCREGERVMYVTLSETPDELTMVAQSHGWSLDGISLFELSSGEGQLEPDEQYTVFHPGEVELSETTKRLCAEVDRVQPSRVVFDSLSEMRLLAREPIRYRRQVLALKQFFIGRRCTVLLLDDRTAQSDLQLQSICHGVIVLERVWMEYGGARRRLIVNKMRGLDFREGYHDFKIQTGGILVYPRIGAVAARTNPDAYAHRQVIGSGIAELDSVLGGGLDEGTSTLLIGPAGTGKSTVATQYAHALSLTGRRAAVFIFEETRENFIERARGLGLDLSEALRDGTITVQQIDAAEMSPGEFAHTVREAVETRAAKLVVIDSLNGYMNAMPSENYLLIQMHELLTLLNERGVLTLMTLAQHGVVGNAMQGPVDVTYLADTVIVLRYFEAFGQVMQALAVVKRRTGPHEHTIRQFNLRPTGIEIGEPLRDFDGVLTGVPTYRGSRGALLEDEDSRATRQ
jgi:circadian clock protein KaiC